MKKVLLNCILILLLTGVIFAQKPSLYEGRHFITGFMQNELNRVSTGIEKSFIIHITSNYNANVTISIPGSNPYTISVTPKTYHQAIIPERLECKTSEVIEKKCIEISSDNPIYVACLNSQFQTSDAFSLIPTEYSGNEYFVVTMGNDYYAPDEGELYSDLSNLDRSIRQGEFLILGYEDNTKVTMFLTADTEKGKLSGNTYDIIVNKGDAFLVKSSFFVSEFAKGTHDLTGTRLTSDKNFGVISGHVRTAVTQKKLRDNDSKDHLSEMLIPKKWLGKAYVGMPFILGPELFYKIIATEPNTQIDFTYGINSFSTTISNIGGVYSTTFGNVPHFIQSNKPIQIGQFMSRNSPTFVGSRNFDPALVILPSVEQLVQEVNFVVPRNISSTFMNNVVTFICDDPARNSLYIDGERAEIYTGFIPIYTQQKTYWLGNINLTSGFHNLKCIGGGFTGIVYGMGMADSYAFTLGGSFVGDLKDNSTPSFVNDNKCINFNIEAYDTLANDLGFHNFVFNEVPVNINYNFVFERNNKVFKLNGNIIDPTIDTKLNASLKMIDGKEFPISYNYIGTKLDFNLQDLLATIRSDEKNTFKLIVNNQSKKEVIIDSIVVGDKRVSHLYSSTITLPISGNELLSFTFNPDNINTDLNDSIVIFYGNGCFRKSIPITTKVIKPSLFATNYDFGKVRIGDTVCNKIDFIADGSLPIIVYELNYIDNKEFSFDTTSLLPRVLDPNASNSLPLQICFTPSLEANQTIEFTAIDTFNIRPKSIVRGQGVRPRFNSIEIDWGKRKLGTKNDSLLIIKNTGSDSGKIRYKYFTKKDYDNDNSKLLESLVNQFVDEKAEVSFPISFIPQLIDTNGYEVTADYFTDYRLHEPVTITLKGSTVFNTPYTYNICEDTVRINKTKEKNKVMLIANLGNDTLTIKDIKLESDDLADFIVDLNSIPRKVAPKDSILISIRFAPKIEGGKNLKIVMLTDGGFAGNDSILSKQICLLAKAWDVIKCEYNINSASQLPCNDLVIPFEFNNEGSIEVTLDSVTFNSDLQGVATKLVSKTISVKEKYRNEFTIVLPAGYSKAIESKAYYRYRTLNDLEYMQEYMDSIVVPITLKSIDQDFQPISFKSNTFSVGDTASVDFEFTFPYNLSKQIRNKISLEVDYDPSLMKADTQNIEVFIDNAKVSGKVTIEKGKALFVSDSALIITSTNKWKVNFPFLVYYSGNLMPPLKFRIITEKDCFTIPIVNEVVDIQKICFHFGRLVSFFEIPEIKASPNPTSDNISIDYKITFEGNAEITATDYLGKEFTLFEEKMKKNGTYTLKLENNILPSGVYVLSLKTAYGVVNTNLLITK
jgi:hypothetical protein